MRLRGWGSRGAHFWDNSRILLYTFEYTMDFTGFGEKDEPKMPHAQKHFGFLGAQTIDAADQTWLIRKPTLEENFHSTRKYGENLVETLPRRGV